MHAEVNSIPISALNHYLYCERRAYLIHSERVFVDNEHTLLGDLIHADVDLPGFEHRAGWELLRSLPLFSDTFGLTGKADIVEVRREVFGAPNGSYRGHRAHDQSPIVEARPVEYKKGPTRHWDNDNVQLCAQAICLEEMFGLHLEAGLIYHAASARRDEVVFDARLRSLTFATIDSVRTTLAKTVAPPAVLKPQCDGCSLHIVCMPEVAIARHTSLFEPRDYS